MPAAAVIPAPLAYINVVAVKKLVVGFLFVVCVVNLIKYKNNIHPLGKLLCYSFSTTPTPIFYCEKIRVFKTGYYVLNTRAWNNKIRLFCIL